MYLPGMTPSAPSEGKRGKWRNDYITNKKGVHGKGSSIGEKILNRTRGCVWV